MPDDVEVALRGPRAYEVARRAIELMESAKVWPTSLNFELWLHVACEPDGALAKDVQRLLTAGDPITDTIADRLAERHLPKARLHDQIRSAGELLSEELATVSHVIHTARLSSAAYGERLAGASQELAAPVDTQSLQELVRGLTRATGLVESENKQLEQRLADSTAEVGRLRDHLAQVRRDATTDGLTHLANRKAFDDELKRACAKADRAGELLFLAVLDIDHFKNFNDTWGHQTGDQVLRYVASVIGRMGAPPRFAARYGGEEFAMIFVAEAERQVDRTLHHVLDEVASRRLKRRSTNEELGAVTISAGFAERRQGESPLALMERADAALYESKRNGRNRVSRAEDRANAA